MIRILLLIIFSLITINANAEVQFNSYINKNPINESELIELTIVCIGDSLDSEPEISSLKDFEIVSQSSSSQMQIINGNIISSNSYIYKLVAKKSGELIIPPIKGYIKNKEYITKEIKVKVISEKKSEKIDSSKDAYLKAEIDKKNTYINEPIIYTLKFYRSVNTEKNNLTLPDFKDFTVEELGKQKDYQKNINGKLYAITEIRKLLIPDKSGLIKIPQSQLLVEIPYKEEDNYFFGYNVKKETKNLKSNEISLNIKKLPNDLSDIVSDKIDYSINISDKSVELGDSINLKIKFFGKGNIYDLVLPDLNIEKAKVYNDKPKSQKNIKDDTLFSEKTFNYGIVPQEAGKIYISFPKIQYFNPELKKYEPIQIKPISLTVVKNSKNTTNTTIIPKQKINDIKNDNKKKNTINLSLFSFILFLIISILIILIIYILYFRKNKKKSISIEIQDLKKQDKEIEFINIDNKNFDEVYRIFIDFIRKNNIPKEKIDEFNLLEEKFFKIKYSGNSNEIDKKNILEEAKNLINSFTR